MSTVKGPLKYIWTGYFEDGKVLEQPADDRWSKHDDANDHNFTAFRDLLDYTMEYIKQNDQVDYPRMYSIAPLYHNKLV